MEQMHRRLPAEWEPQSGIIFAWPDSASDWRDDLERVQRCVAAIIREISVETRVVLVAADAVAAEDYLSAYGADMANLQSVQIPLNDSWTRDYGPITVFARAAAHPDGAASETPLLLDWVFNGWGMKYPAHRDNMITRRLAVHGIFGDAPLETVPHVLEGGSVESDGCGTILTTAQCLLDYNRSPDADIDILKQRLQRYLGAERVLWLHNGRLAGDDTDSHIDTLARFCDPGTIAYTAPSREQDEHWASLTAMRDELAQFTTADGSPYRLVPLPLPSPLYNDAGRRLPATYANFLITDNSVWVPQYGVPEDAAAFSTMIGLFPGRTIHGVDCLPLIQQNGSLHCITMQLPRGVLASSRESTQNREE